MPADPHHLQSRLASAAPDLELSFRPMFGGVMAYAAGKPLASLSNVGLALKLSGPAQAEALALPGAEPLRYEPNDPPSKTYVVLPPEIVADDAALHAWAHRAAAALPAPKPKRAR